MLPLMLPFLVLLLTILEARTGTDDSDSYAMGVATTRGGEEAEEAPRVSKSFGGEAVVDRRCSRRRCRRSYSHNRRRGTACQRGGRSVGELGGVL